MSENKACECACRKKMRPEKEKRALVNRLSRIEGQVRGLKGMIEADAYCPDVIIQISACEAALSSLSRVLLREHINTCVLEDIKSGKESAADELAQLLSRLGK